MARPSLEERLARFDIDSDGCWIWGMARDRYGYGTVTVENQKRLAHRAVYQRFVDELPTDVVLDHLCRKRDCVNPDHLEPVTHAENINRGLASPTKTHCVNGHERSPENIYENAGRRNCRACVRDRQRKYQARLKVVAS